MKRVSLIILILTLYPFATFALEPLTMSNMKDVAVSVNNGEVTKNTTNINHNDSSDTDLKVLGESHNSALFQRTENDAAQQADKTYRFQQMLNSFPMPER